MPLGLLGSQDCHQSKGLFLTLKVLSVILILGCTFESSVGCLNSPCPRDTSDQWNRISGDGSQATGVLKVLHLIPVFRQGGPTVLQDKGDLPRPPFHCYAPAQCHIFYIPKLTSLWGLVLTIPSAWTFSIFSFRSQLNGNALRKDFFHHCTSHSFLYPGLLSSWHLSVSEII